MRPGGELEVAEEEKEEGGKRRSWEEKKEMVVVVVVELGCFGYLECYSGCFTIRKKMSYGYKPIVRPTDRPTDQPMDHRWTTDGHTILQRCMDASKNPH